MMKQTYIEMLPPAPAGRIRLSCRSQNDFEMTSIQPVFPLLLLILMTVALRRRVARKTMLATSMALALWTWPPFAWLFTRTVEGRYPLRTIPPPTDAGAIVVLAWNVYPPRPGAPEPVADSYTYERSKFAAWLFRNWRPLPVLVCGGKLTPGGESAAAAMRRILVNEGVPPAMIWTDDESASTYENALYGSRILRGHGVGSIVLVTHAFHMLRSERCFARQGIKVAPAPAGYETFHDAGFEEYLPNWRAVRVNELTLHELGGLLWYFVRRRI
jgi:uncharacterized SAM-binding protein YcdF (DUF218 family)